MRRYVTDRDDLRGRGNIQLMDPDPWIQMALDWLQHKGAIDDVRDPDVREHIRGYIKRSLREAEPKPELEKGDELLVVRRVAQQPASIRWHKEAPMSLGYGFQYGFLKVTGKLEGS
jgi:hypothetical protein